MKATRLMIISLLAMIMMVGCKGKTDKVEQTAENSVTDSLQKNLSPGELPDSLQKYLMPEELSDTAIAHIRQSITTADTLMGQTSFYKEEMDAQFSKTAYQLMERMMVKSSNYDGIYVYAHEWACQDTVAHYFMNYLNHRGAALQKMDSLQYRKIMDVFGPILDDFRGGSQMDLNSAAHVEMNMETLKTIGTYKDMVALCNDKVLSRAYFMDYADWIDLFNGVVIRQEGGYSMFPLEANDFGSRMMQLRYRLLQEEMALKRGGESCLWDVKTNKINWSEENADLVRIWHDHRMGFVDAISDKRVADNFKAMTEKIAYLFLNKVKFNTDWEGEDDDDEL